MAKARAAFAAAPAPLPASGGIAEPGKAYALSLGRRASIDADHHVGGLDHGIGGLSDLELQRIDGFVGDGGCWLRVLSFMAASVMSGRL